MQTYNQLANNLRAEKYEANRNISSLLLSFPIIPDKQGQVCGICGLTDYERTILEDHYLLQINRLKNVLGSLDAFL